MAYKIVILEVPEDKCAGFVEAMTKRDWPVYMMDREGRKKLVDCPGCRRKLTKEKSFTIDGELVNDLTKILQKMVVSKTVIITNKNNPMTSVPPIEYPRCIEVDPVSVFQAESLGLIKKFQDGNRQTHYVTAVGISFLNGEKPASPCTMVTLDGEVVETAGELTIEGVKYETEISAGTLKRAALDAVKAIPEHVMQFVINGQMSLI